jgi:pimeloyl-ACP methyl ester carboxylesterase
MILVGAVGIKPGDRETRDIPDIYALSPEEVDRLIYHDPSYAPDMGKLSDAELEAVARERESGALYVWEPYMHHPKLMQRLRRVQIPVLYLRGVYDGIISAFCAKTYCAAFPDARLDTIEEAGHCPDIEQPDAVAERVVRFMRSAGSHELAVGSLSG